MAFSTEIHSLGVVGDLNVGWVIFGSDTLPPGSGTPLEPLETGSRIRGEPNSLYLFSLPRTLAKKPQPFCLLQIQGCPGAKRCHEAAVPLLLYGASRRWLSSGAGRL